MKRFMLASVIASMLGIASAASAAPAPGIAGDIEVMTQNQYLGADIAPLIATINDPVAFNAEVVAALEQIVANNTPARIQALAGEILGRRPHLVGLQEVWQFNCVPAGPTLAPCNDVRIAGSFQNHLTLTASALGNSYVTAAVVENFKVDSFTFPDPTDPTKTITVQGIPFAIDGLPFQPGVPTGFLQVMDRDVILARADVPATPVAYPCLPAPSAVSVDGCNYAAALPLGALGSVKRGFVAVDATVAGKNYRFVNTHLEVEAGGLIPPDVQYYQAGQLLGTVLNPLLTPAGVRLIIVGDMNSSPNDPVVDGVATPYMLFTASDLYDAWLVRPGNVAGLSCCQLEDLSNRASLLTRRIDLILSREMPRAVKDARLIGAVAADRLAPPGKGLWPSDHASVAAGLRY